MFDIAAALAVLNVKQDTIKSVIEYYSNLKVDSEVTNEVKQEPIKKEKEVLSKEEKRLLLNQKSRENKLRMKKLLEDQDLACLGPDRIEDKHGISALDRRRYKQCFDIYEDSSLVNIEYVMRMTGLTFHQIQLLEKETKLVSTKKAKYLAKYKMSI